MKKSVHIFTLLKTKIHTKKFVEENKLSSKAFLRCRILPFAVIFLFILNLLRKSIPKELNSFCKNLNTKKTTRSAITQARAKICPQAFVKLNNLFIEEYYRDNNYLTYKNFILLAIDGSTLQLPNSPEILKKYGCVTNNTSEVMPSARVSCLYDVLNGITLHACLKPYKSDERTMEIEHFEALKSLHLDLTKFLVIFDRGYPSIALIYYLIKNKMHFLIRSGKGFIKEIAEILKLNKKDTTLTITPKRLKKITKSKEEIIRLGFEVKEDIVFRIVTIELQTGEQEILLTSLMCKQKYPYNMFLKLYFNRWGIEESYKFIKTIEVENFSGKSTLVIEQDFHATVLVANSHALLASEAKDEIKDLEKKNKSDAANLDQAFSSDQRKYEYCINKRVSVESLKNEFVGILLNPDSSVEAFCERIKKIMKYDLIPKRPNRSYKRIRRNTCRKYHMNQR